MAPHCLQQAFSRVHLHAGLASVKQLSARLRDKQGIRNACSAEQQVQQAEAEAQRRMLDATRWKGHADSNSNVMQQLILRKRISHEDHITKVAMECPPPGACDPTTISAVSAQVRKPPEEDSSRSNEHQRLGAKYQMGE